MQATTASCRVIISMRSNPQEGRICARTFMIVISTTGLAADVSCTAGAQRALHGNSYGRPRDQVRPAGATRALRVLNAELAGAFLLILTCC